jgi:hypothetical protein
MSFALKVRVRMHTNDLHAASTPSLHGVLSGISALIYQLVWQRALLTIYGSNVESVAMVVAAFLAGLGIGSLAGGWISKSTRAPLVLLFGLAELGVGAYGLISLKLFDAVGAITSAQAHGLTTGALVFLLVFLPTLLMGATLPLLVAHQVRDTAHVGQSVSRLYFVNTLGAALGAFIAAHWLLGSFGMSGTVRIAASLNALAAFIVLLHRTKAPPAADQPADITHLRSLRNLKSPSAPPCCGPRCRDSSPSRGKSSGPASSTSPAPLVPLCSATCSAVTCSDSRSVRCLVRDCWLKPAISAPNSRAGCCYRVWLDFSSHRSPPSLHHMCLGNVVMFSSSLLAHCLASPSRCSATRPSHPAKTLAASFRGSISPTSSAPAQAACSPASCSWNG